jgi:hypothetical protein
MFFFQAYATDQSATIKSKRVGVVYRTAQIVFITYIIGWELIKNKTYQATDIAFSAVTTKVKGQGVI